MDSEKFKKKTKKIAGTTNANVISTEHLNPDYEIETFPNNSTTSTGLLKVAILNPKNSDSSTFSDLPTFIFR